MECEEREVEEVVRDARPEEVEGALEPSVSVLLPARPGTPSLDPEATPPPTAASRAGSCATGFGRVRGLLAGPSHPFSTAMSRSLSLPRSSWVDEG